MRRIQRSETRKATVYVIDGGGFHLAEFDRLFSSVHLQADYFSSLTEAVDHLCHVHHGCVIADMTELDLDGNTFMRQLRESGVELPVIFIAPPGPVETAIHALKAGCTDYLEKPYSGQALLDAVYDAIEQDQVRTRRRNINRELSARLESLTAREWDVLLPMIRGASNREIAMELNVSPRTVEVYRSRIMEKTRAANLPELILIAMRLEMLR